MYAITGITGRVGGTAAKALLAAGKKVRAVLRDPSKAEPFVALGAEVAIADFNEVDALTAAFTDVEGVFVMVPPYFAPVPGFPEAKAIIAILQKALATARPSKVIGLSSIGAQHDHDLGLITQSHLFEEALGELPIPVGFVRPAWFMENAQWDIDPARETGAFPSFLLPLDRPIPMVATEDIGRVVSETLLSDWQGKRIIELEGPRRYSPDDLAHVLTGALGKSVQAVAVPREKWTEVFEVGGMPVGRTGARAEMVDGFNSGWIEFEGEPLRGQTDLETAIARLVRGGR